MSSIQESVLRTYHQMVVGTGKRGAYGRTAKRYGISDETVRRWVHAGEQPCDPDLAYEPPPGGYPTPHPAESTENMPQNMPHERENATELPQFATDDDVPPVQDDATPQPENATCGIAEPEIEPVAFHATTPHPIVWLSPARPVEWWISGIFWLIACAQEHMVWVQLVVGFVVVWLLRQAF